MLFKSRLSHIFLYNFYIVKHSCQAVLASVMISKIVTYLLVIARSGATKQSLVMQRVEIASLSLAMTDYCKVINESLH
jgi:hypothetical protein